MSPPAELGRRAEELASRVIGPLVLGGAIAPVRPFGPDLALALGEQRAIVDSDLASRVDVARVRRARLLAPIDTLPGLEPFEWALAAGLNDLLQVTNHELAGRLTQGRRARLLDSVRALCARVPPPRDVGEALARHATFARVLELFRTDTVVSWWTGKAHFRGESPASRLLKWPELRRVSVERQRIALPAMADGLAGVTREQLVLALAVWLGRSPLTDLATAARLQPAFQWSASTLSLIGAPPGRVLALRAIARGNPRAAAAALRAAEGRLEGPAQSAATAFAAEVTEAAAADRGELPA